MKEKIKFAAKNILYSIYFSFIISKKFFIYKCILLIISAVFPFINAWIWKELLNEISSSRNIQTLVVLLCVYIFISVLSQLHSSLDEYVQMNYDDAISVYKDNKFIDLYTRVDLNFFDSASMNDKINIASGGYGALLDLTWMLFGLFSALISLIISFYIVSSYSVIIGLLTIVFLIPEFIYNRWYAKMRLKLQEQLERDSRKCGYYSSVFNDYSMQFEIKLNNIGGYFFQRYKELWEKLYRINRKQDIKNSLKTAMLGILQISSDIMVIVSSVLNAARMNIHIGDIQYNISMVASLRSNAVALFNSVNSILQNNDRIAYLNEFEKIKTISEKSGGRLPGKNPEIEFRNVSFRYPNSEDYVLKNCSFKLNTTEKNCLVGLNGSGKSTIIKLIFRFYEPEEGEILYDGVNLKEYDIRAVRKIFGVLFQEYVPYNIKLREVIALSDISQVNNDARLTAACEESGFSKVIETWGNGFDSYLGRTFVSDGKDLSGGQWQLLGLSRAYFRQSDFMILDEPSASLDPITEDALFRHLMQLSSDKGALTISHRLSNTILADSILVLEDGRIIEHGNHDDLMTLGGKYAHLFNLQAERYKNDDE